MDMTVTGIVAPPPANSSIQFDLIGSFATQREQQWMIRNNPWNMRSFPTYLRLAKGVDREDLAAAIPSLLMTHTTSESVTRYELEPLRSIYLDSVGGDGGLGISGDEHDVYLFATTATLVLLLACINYTNLATARSTRRAREVGVRKAIGAHPASLRMQFMGESVAMCLTAGLIGAMIAELGTELLQRMEAITLADLPWTDPVFVAGYVGVAILTGLMSGLYPALVLSRSEVATTVHHRGRSGGSPLLRRGLVVAQFSIATALLVGVLVIRQQLQYIQDQRLGLQTQQVLAIDNHDGLDLAQSRIFRQELRRNAAILSPPRHRALYRPEGTPAAP
jgi:putative ABC transport system permease protein